MIPALGAEYTYQVQAPVGQLQEQTTISTISNDTFTAVRKSDTIGGFSTTDSERYVLRSSGDLFPISSICDCDSLPLPIGSHKTFTEVPADGGIPTKLKGFVDSNSSVSFQTQYDDEETIIVAGVSFPCSKVSDIKTIIAESGQVGGGVDTTIITHLYWYSPEIGFFVKDQEIDQTGDSTTVEFTRTLVSYKL